MIATRIIDNDMGKVAKVPLTGIGTIHGLTISLDFVTDQKKATTERIVLPEFSMGLVEMLAADMGVPKVVDHCEEHIGNSEREAKFVETYREFVKPINTSGKYRY
jgi:hypothetical protein